MSDVETSSGNVRVALLTAGRDKPYAYGMATALIGQGLPLDIVGADDLESAGWHRYPGVKFFNLRGDMRSDATLAKKVLRVMAYYLRLIRYAATAKPKLFHILWNNKLEAFDRSALMLYYKLLGKRVVLTVHNVNARKRDSNDTWLNRVTLKIQYKLADHLLVHTERMKKELVEEYGVAESSITIVPFGINNDVPVTDLTCSEAKHNLGISEDDRTILFFGHIAPYKGLEYLLDAFQYLTARSGRYRLIIAGNPKNGGEYWSSLQDTIRRKLDSSRILQRIEHIPDGETELYFKAADVLALPYRHIYQSGVLFLSYRFGLPVVATDVGSLRDDIVEGKTGFVCKPDDSADLARAFETYFASGLFDNLDSRRKEIQDHVRERHSWAVVGRLTATLYRKLLTEEPFKQEAHVTAR
jgi:glycosyltransferase involved in cell wall biosynthesis